jgi:hypothetical protein
MGMPEAKGIGAPTLFFLSVRILFQGIPSLKNMLLDMQQVYPQRTAEILL